MDSSGQAAFIDFEVLRKVSMYRCPLYFSHCCTAITSSFTDHNLPYDQFHHVEGSLVATGFVLACHSGIFPYRNDSLIGIFQTKLSACLRNFKNLE